jgi:hypothetical protein
MFVPGYSALACSSSSNPSRRTQARVHPGQSSFPTIPGDKRDPQTPSPSGQLCPCSPQRGSSVPAPQFILVEVPSWLNLPEVSTPLKSPDWVSGARARSSRAACRDARELRGQRGGLLRDRHCTLSRASKRLPDGAIAMLTSSASSMVCANMRVPGGRSPPDFSRAGGIEIHTGASGISSPRRRAAVDCRSMAADSSGPTARSHQVRPQGKERDLALGRASAHAAEGVAAGPALLARVRCEAVPIEAPLHHQVFRARREAGQHRVQIARVIELGLHHEDLVLGLLGHLGTRQHLQHTALAQRREIDVENHGILRGQALQPVRGGRSEW